MTLGKNKHFKWIESSEINPHTYGQLFYDKSKIYNGERTVFWINVGNMGYAKE